MNGSAAARCTSDAGCNVSGSVCYVMLSDAEALSTALEPFRPAGAPPGCFCTGWLQWRADREGGCAGPFGPVVYMYELVGFVIAALSMVLCALLMRDLFSLSRFKRGMMTTLTAELVVSTASCCVYQVLNVLGATRTEEYSTLNADGDHCSVFSPILSWVLVPYVCVLTLATCKVILVWIETAATLLNSKGKTKQLARIRLTINVIQYSYAVTMLAICVLQWNSVVALFSLPFIIMLLLFVAYSRAQIIAMLTSADALIPPTGTAVPDKETELATVRTSIARASTGMLVALSGILLVAVVYSLSMMLPAQGWKSLALPGQAPVSSILSQVMQVCLAIALVSITLYARRLNANVVRRDARKLARKLTLTRETHSANSTNSMKSREKRNSTSRSSIAVAPSPGEQQAPPSSSSAAASAGSVSAPS
jgi:hypothetical protein